MNRVSITILGDLLEQQFYEIDDVNRDLLQSMIVNQKGKTEIDDVATKLQLVNTIKSFVTDKTRMTIKIDGIPITTEPLWLSVECFYNHTYGCLDSSTYSDPIIINTSSRVFTSHPEEWIYATQRLFDYSRQEQYLSALNSLLIKGANDTNLQDKEYWVKTITHFSVFQYEFTIIEDFDFDKLGIIIDPNLNFYNSKENVIPDFLLYDDIYCGGEEVYSTDLKYDWAKGLLKTTAEFVIEYSTGKDENEECDTITTVPF